MATKPQIEFIESLIRQLERVGVVEKQDLAKLTEISTAMKSEHEVRDLTGNQASCWIEDLLTIKHHMKNR